VEQTKFPVHHSGQNYVSLNKSKLKRFLTLFYNLLITGMQSGPREPIGTVRSDGSAVGPIGVSEKESNFDSVI
jgi:hypothetical protein